jgi:hypothetical protein
MPSQLFKTLLVVIAVSGIGFIWLVGSFTGVNNLLFWVMAVMVPAVGAYGMYAAFSLNAQSKTFATMEGNFLFVRRGDEEHGQVQVGIIDLAQPFEARCTFAGLSTANYQVKQDRQVVSFAVPMSGDGRAVREGLKLPWPPTLTS